jgi:hypothetical protein
MKIDISFIPKENLPNELEEISKKTIEYPYIKNIEVVDEELDNGKGAEECLSLLDRRRQYRYNYYAFEKALFEFGKEEYNKRNYELAKNSLQYLMEIGSKKPEVRDILVKLYIKEKNLLGMKWIAGRIKNDLKDELIDPVSKQKLSKIKKKYLNRF